MRGCLAALGLKPENRCLCPELVEGLWQGPPSLLRELWRDNACLRSFGSYGKVKPAFASAEAMARRSEAH